MESAIRKGKEEKERKKKPTIEDPELIKLAKTLEQLDKKRKLSDAAQSMETDSQETGDKEKRQGTRSENDNYHRQDRTRTEVRHQDMRPRTDNKDIKLGFLGDSNIKTFLYSGKMLGGIMASGSESLVRVKGGQGSMTWRR